MKEQQIIEILLRGVKEAEAKHPVWPDDILHGLAIISEEHGELAKAAYENVYEGGHYINVQAEAFDTMVTCFRLLKNIKMV